MKFKKINLKKGNEYIYHPDINLRQYYIAKVDNNLYLGKFTKEWYGLNFDCGWGNSGIQFDTPGTNSSRWQELWEIIK